MGLYNLLTSPTGTPYYAQTAFINPNTVSTANVFGQRSIPWPSNDSQPYVRIPMPPLESSNSNNSNGIFNFDPVQGFTGQTPNDISFRNRIRYNSDSWGPDFLTRGNLFGLVRTADDIERLTKYFFDFTRVGNGGTVNGLFFTLKQNLLAAAGNDGTIYTPLSTLAQAAISLSGKSVKKQGLFAGINEGVFKSSTEIGPDFRSAVISPSGSNVEVSNETLYKNRVTFLSASPNYQGNGNIENRINFRSGGEQGDISDYTKGKRILRTDTPLGPLDKINALSIYESDTAANTPSVKDLVDFRIAIINNYSIGQENPITSHYLHFRAFIDNFDDSYSADWKAVEYVGRAEKFYRYGGFKRDMSLAFTVVASSKEELIPMYKKINFLASSLSPSYSENGYMMGNMSKLTIGDYITEQPGIITSLKIDIPDGSPWEINLGLDGEPMKDMRQVPHMLKIKMSFIPIHRFRPEIMRLDNVPGSPTLPREDNIVYGDQRYISLKNQTSGHEGSYSPISQGASTSQGIPAFKGIPVDYQY